MQTLGAQHMIRDQVVQRAEHCRARAHLVRITERPVVAHIGSSPRREARHGSKNIARCPDSWMFFELSAMEEATWGEFADSGF